MGGFSSQDHWVASEGRGRHTTYTWRATLDIVVLVVDVCICVLRISVGFMMAIPMAPAVPPARSRTRNPGWVSSVREDLMCGNNIIAIDV
jgi:hypothetical protein